MRRWLICLAAVVPLAAQDDRFELRTITMNAKDKLHRELVQESNTVWLGVRLSEQQDPPLVANTQVGTAERSYSMGEQGYVKFAISDGVSRPAFAVYKDESKSLNYELVGLVRDPGKTSDRVVKLDKGMLPVSKQSPAVIPVRTPDYQAPLQPAEMALFAGFLAVAVALVYWAFARHYFSRLLFNRRKRVSQALSLSNVWSAFWILLLLVAGYLLFTGPDFVPSDYQLSCALVMAGYAVLALLGYGLALATSKK